MSYRQQKTMSSSSPTTLPGTSHAAGKYHPDDKQAGYWDKIIGPGKAIDTNAFFVISVDTLVNANAYDKNVITTGPASINPETGKKYGLNFPVVTIRGLCQCTKKPCWKV